MNNLSNKDIYKEIQRIALLSFLFKNKAFEYFVCQYYDYAPMIKDELFLTYFDQQEVIGVETMERVLGRRLKVDELNVCPLSATYFLFGHPIVEETETCRNKLIEFYRLIEDMIRKGEKRTRTNLRKRLAQ